jgi:hypothetical protein
VARRLWSLFCAAALPDAGLDVPGPAGDFLLFQGAALLHWRGISHAACDGRNRWRALGCFPAQAGPPVVKASSSPVLRPAGPTSARWLLPLQSSGPLMHFALKNQRRPSRGDRLAGTGQDRRRHPRFPAPGAAGQRGRPVGNYGEQGAIELLGPAYNLPPPISLTNSAWLRGYPTPPPTTLIVVGCRAKKVDSDIHRLHAGRAQRQLRGNQERGEPVPPRHLRLRQPAPALAGVLEEVPVLRLKQTRDALSRAAPPRGKP